MQCRICGSTIGETDTVCKVCGAVQEGKKPVQNEEFHWTVHDFSKPKKTVEEVKMEWPKEPGPVKRNVNLDEPISFDIDALKKRSVQEKPLKEEKAPSAEPVKKVPFDGGSGEFAAASARKESLSKADTFFDFSKANTEFQEVLDQEYDKLQKSKEGIPYEESPWRYQPEATAAEKAGEFHLSENPQDALERMISEGTQEMQTDGEATIQVDLSAIKRAAAKRYGYEFESALDDIIKETVPETAAAAVSATAAKSGQGTTAAAETSAAAANFTAASGVNTAPTTPIAATMAPPAMSPVTAAAEASAATAGTAASPAADSRAVCKAETAVQSGGQAQKFKKRQTMTEMERAREEYFRMLDQENGGVQVKVEVNTPYGQAGRIVADVDIQPDRTAAKKRNFEPIYEELNAQEPLELEEVFTEPPVSAGSFAGTFTQPLAKQADAIVASVETSVQSGQKAGDFPTSQEKETKASDEPKEEMVWPLSPEDYEEEKEGGALSVIGKILLVLIAIVVALELAALGILYFAPTSGAANIVYSVQEKVTDFIASIRGDDQPVVDEQDTPDESGDSQQVSGESQGAETDGAVDTAPMADKAALIATQLGRNKNIGSITANDALVYKAGVNYGNADLNASKPIENNVWYTTDDGTVVYYDREIVGTLIAFNSQWIDYVNNGDKSALSLTKEGSRAYKNASEFSKVGKVKEEFLSVELGEIRQGEQGNYLWAKEQIRLVENGVSSTVNYQWVYCMEPVDGQMKIVDYINVKNK